jgi:hypothetical protein
MGNVLRVAQKPPQSDDTATQALPMLPADLKVIMDYLDSPEAIKYFTVTQRLYFKVFVATAFTL